MVTAGVSYDVGRFGLSEWQAIFRSRAFELGLAYRRGRSKPTHGANVLTCVPEATWIGWNTLSEGGNALVAGTDDYTISASWDSERLSIDVAARTEHLADAVLDQAWDLAIRTSREPSSEEVRMRFRSATTGRTNNVPCPGGAR